MTDRVDVPCGLCRTCCQTSIVFLKPEYGDDPSQYHTVDMVDPSTGRVGIALQRRANGECVYLGISGCTIHDRAPGLCRTYDCKVAYERLRKIWGAERVDEFAEAHPPVDVGRRRSKGMRP